MKIFTNALKKLFSSEDSSSGNTKRATKRPKLDPTMSAEQLCGIQPGMQLPEIKDHLAMLYRRHNRAASSLDENLRAEAEIMLDAIVECREKYLG